MPKPPKISSASRPFVTTTQNHTETLPTAGVMRRLAAMIYDAFLLLGLITVPLLIVIAIRSPKIDPANTQNITVQSIAPGPIIPLYAAVIIVSFYGYFWRTSGQTLGMQTWRIRVDSNSGGRPSWKQCLLRAVIGSCSLLCAGLGYWWLWIDNDRASWHDRASNTRVVVLPKQKK